MTLSVEEVKSALKAVYSALEERKAVLFLRAFRLSSANTLPNQTFQPFEMKMFFIDTIASRLVDNDRNVELISVNDFRVLWEMILKQQLSSQGLDDEATTDAFNFTWPTLKPYFSRTILSSYANTFKSYRDEWKNVDLVFSMAAERGISVDRLFDIPGVTDEFLRRRYTKDELVGNMSEVLGFFVGTEELIYNLQMSVARGLFPNESDHEIIETMSNELKKQMPKNREEIMKAQSAFTKVLMQEVERIFG